MLVCGQLISVDEGWPVVPKPSVSDAGLLAAVSALGALVVAPACSCEEAEACSAVAFGGTASWLDADAALSWSDP